MNIFNFNEIGQIQDGSQDGGSKISTWIHIYIQYLKIYEYKIPFNLDSVHPVYFSLKILLSSSVIESTTTKDYCPPSNSCWVIAPTDRHIFLSLIIVFIAPTDREIDRHTKTWNCEEISESDFFTVTILPLCK